MASRRPPEPSTAPAYRSPPLLITILWNLPLAMSFLQWEVQKGATLSHLGQEVSCTCLWTPAIGTRRSALVPAAASPPRAGCQTFPPVSPSHMFPTMWRETSVMLLFWLLALQPGHLWGRRAVGAGRLGWSCGSSSTSTLQPSARHCRPSSRRATRLAPVSPRTAG